MTGNWIERLSLTNFRSYSRAELHLAPQPIILVGENGSGKTNLIEAVSLLGAGQGLRRAAYADLRRAGGDGGWSVSALVHTADGPVRIGTGQAATGGDSVTAEQNSASGRMVRIDQVPRSPNALADYVDVVWLTPAMDGLFTGPAGDRRRFLDRLVLCVDPAYRKRLGQFERAVRQRNKLLEDASIAGRSSASQFDALEQIIAETGTAIAAIRLEAVSQIRDMISARHAVAPESPFPWAEIRLEGWLEDRLAEQAAVDVEDAYARKLAEMRPRDRAARRTLEGPHRSDLVVVHGPKQMPARLSSTGEQKGLLINLVLAHAELIRRLRRGAAPLLLLDEIAAHLDTERRAALFENLSRLAVQPWMTGTDFEPFSELAGTARFLTIQDTEIIEINR